MSRPWPGCCARRSSITVHTRRPRRSIIGRGSYAAYIVAREMGRTPDEADADARRYMAGILAEESSGP